MQAESQSDLTRQVAIGTGLGTCLADFGDGDTAVGQITGAVGGGEVGDALAAQAAVAVHTKCVEQCARNAIDGGDMTVAKKSANLNCSPYSFKRSAADKCAYGSFYRLTELA